VSPPYFIGKYRKGKKEKEEKKKKRRKAAGEIQRAAVTGNPRSRGLPLVET